MSSKFSDFKRIPRWEGVTLLVCGVLLFAPGCRSKLEVTVKKGSKAAELPAPEVKSAATGQDENQDGAKAKDKAPTSVEVANNDILMLKGRKKYFQTRDTITLTVKREILEGASTYTLSNTTKVAAGEAPVELIKDAVPEFGLSLDGSFRLAELNSDSLILEFYPGEKRWKDKFFYGKNTLKLSVDDAVEPRYVVTELVLRDFDVFGVAVTSFDEDVQVKTLDGKVGNHFQGWLNVLSPPTLATDTGTLTHGIFSMVNPK